MAYQERIKLWTDALRSNKFVQGQGRLRRNNRYCCLGVACELYHRETGSGKWQEGIFYSDLGSSAYTLPDLVREWYGLTSANPRLTHETTAVSANDEGVTFVEIANMLDARYLDKPQQV